MKKWLIIGGIVLLLLAIVIPWLLLANGWADEARDLAIILLALFHLVTVTLMIILIGVVVILVNEIRNLAKNTLTPKVSEVLDNVKGITDNAKVTSTTAKQTASYVAEDVVSPVIKAAGLLAGVKAAAKSLGQRKAQQSLPIERNIEE